MKECRRCHKCKPLSEFFIDKSSSDNHQAWCKDCRKEYQKNYGLETGYYKQYKRTKKYKIQQSEYSRRKEVRERLNEQRRKRWAENPEKYRRISRDYYAQIMANSPEKRQARDKINEAIRFQGFPKATVFNCELCDRSAEEYHHPSYEKEDWLNVIPLCKKRHAWVHKQ